MKSALRADPPLDLGPAVVTLFLWMIVPLAMTLYFSVVRYNLMQPGPADFIGLLNFTFFVTDPDFGPSIVNTLLLLGSVIGITVVLGHDQVEAMTLADRPANQFVAQFIGTPRMNVVAADSLPQFEAQLVSRQNARSSLSAGDSVGIAFDPAAAHLFDAQGRVASSTGVRAH